MPYLIGQFSDIRDGPSTISLSINQKDKQPLSHIFYISNSRIS